MSPSFYFSVLIAAAKACGVYSKRAVHKSAEWLSALANESHTSARGFQRGIICTHPNEASIWHTQMSPCSGFYSSPSFVAHENCHQRAIKSFSVNYVTSCNHKLSFYASPNQATAGQGLRRSGAWGPLLCPTLVHCLLKTAVDECPHIPAVHSLQT